MKRDLDLVRTILLRAESAPYGTLSASALSEEGTDTRTVAAHFQLLSEAGLLEAGVLTLEREGAIDGNVLRLTWDGHDYLDAIRSASTWNKVKKLVADKLGSAPFEIVKSLAVKIASDHLGLGHG